MNLNDDGPVKTLDCGSEGYIASVTHWHELLYLSAPDPQCGSVYIMGRFPRTAEALLARAHRRDQSGGKGTFGIQFLPDENFSLGECYTRGLINHRWPHIQYEFVSEDIFGYSTYEQDTFVNDGVVYQLTRIMPGHKKRRRDTKGPQSTSIPPIKMKIGGPASFGCLCTVEHTSESLRHRSQILGQGDDRMLTCAFALDQCEAELPKRGSLHMELFKNGEKQRLHVGDKQRLPTRTDDSTGKGVETDLSSIHTIHLEPQKECIVIFALSITNGTTQPRVHRKAPTSDDVQTILGVKNDAKKGIYNQTGNLWSFSLPENDLLKRNDLQAVARTCEYLLSVSCLYFKSFNMKDSHSLQELLSHYASDNDSERVKYSETVAYRMDAETRQDGNPCNIALPEEAPEDNADSLGRGSTENRLGWMPHGRWLETAVFIENLFFMPSANIRGIL